MKTLTKTLTTLFIICTVGIFSADLFAQPTQPIQLYSPSHPGKVIITQEGTYNLPKNWVVPRGASSWDTVYMVPEKIPSQQVFLDTDSFVVNPNGWEVKFLSGFAQPNNPYTGFTGTYPNVFYEGEFVKMSSTNPLPQLVVRILHFFSPNPLIYINNTFLGYMNETATAFEPINPSNTSWGYVDTVNGKLRFNKNNANDTFHLEASDYWGGSLRYVSPTGGTGTVIHANGTPVGNARERFTIPNVDSVFRFLNPILVFRTRTIPPPKVTLTVSSSNTSHGTVTTSPTNLSNINSGTLCTLTATPNNCYRFLNWTRKGTSTVISAANPYIFTVANNDSLVANFELITYSITVSNAGNGSVETVPTDLTNIACGTVCTLTATANSGYKFVNWSNGATNNPLEITLVSDTNLVANFEEEENPITKFTVSLNLNPEYAGAATGEGSYDSNSTVSIHATANECYVFVDWTDSEGNFVSDENPFEFTVVSDTVLTANFETITNELTLKANPITGGTFSMAIFGCDEAEIFAIASEGYEFVNWTDESGAEISDENPYEIILISDTVVVANFNLVSITENTLISSIKILPNPIHQDAIIEINSLENQTNTTVSILDLSGREIMTVYSGMLNEGINNFPLLNNNLASGTYFVLVKNGNGRKTEQFIIAK